MAPLTEALKVHFVKGDGNESVYSGDIDGEWTVIDVPNGGYVLGLVIEASIAHQRRTTNTILAPLPNASAPHTDPVHVSAHFLRATVVGVPYEVCVRTVKSGKGFSNVVAEMVQKDYTTITTHIIFGNLTNRPSAAGAPSLTLAPPSAYARRIPLNVHPSKAPSTPMRRPWRFKHRVRWAEDATILERNVRGTQTDSERGGLEWGAWFELTGDSERITPAAIAFFADTFVNLPELLPKGERPGLKLSWFPTMVMNIEFKAPIPVFGAGYSGRTVGLYSSARFMHDPQGRHDAYVEVWTAPDGGEEAGWRERQVCIATATQMALTVPAAVNSRQGGGRL